MKNNLETTEKNLEERVVRYLKKIGLLYKKNKEILRFLPQGDGTKKIYKYVCVFPDIEVFVPNNMVLFLEIKRENGKVNDNKKEVFNSLSLTCFDILIVRPSNWEKVKKYLSYLSEPGLLMYPAFDNLEKRNEIYKVCGYFNENKNEK